MLDFQKYVKYLVCSIESLKYVWEFYTPVCYCGDISTPKNMTLNETNCDWLFDVGQMASWVGIGQWKLP